MMIALLVLCLVFVFGWLVAESTAVGNEEN